MSLSSSVLRRRRALAAGAATTLAVATLATLSLSAQAAPTSAAAAEAEAKKGYTGAPANPKPYTLTQPDGDTLRVYRFGNALSNGVATVKGNYTIVKGKDGYWRYAAGLTASGKVKPSSAIAGEDAPPAAAKDLAPAPRAKATQAEAPLAGTGDDKQLVILVEFTDVKHKVSGSTEAIWANHYFGDTASVDDFYEEASQGQYGLAPAAETCGTANNGVTDWISLPMAHPNTGAGFGDEQYIADAIAATNACVNYASFDTSPADGTISTNELHVTFIGAGFEGSYGGEDCGKTIWGHQWDLNSAGITPPTVDGVTVGESGYTTFGEWHCNAGDNPGHKATMGIMAHELGHDINWPDLYDTDGSGEGVGEWSLMGSGSWGETVGAGSLPGDSPTHPDAYSLYYQGWVMPTTPAPAGDIPVNANASLLLGPNPDGTDWLFSETEGDGEFFILENRNRQGYDQSTPGCGILIYRVNETVTPSNAANADYANPLVKVMQADGLEQLNASSRGDAGDPWPGSTNNQNFNNTSTPNTKFHDGTPSNLALHVDPPGSTCASTMTVDLTTLGGASPAVTRPANDLFANATTINGASGNVSQSTLHATVETGEPKPMNSGRASVWFNWTPAVNGNVTMTTATSSYDTVLGLYTGSAVNALTQVAANDDENFAGGVYTSRLVTAVTAGTTYRVMGAGYGGDTGTLNLAWNLVPASVATTVAAVHVPEPSTYGSASSVNVTVSGGTPTGQVTVTEGGTTLGTGMLSGGQVSIALPATLPAGSHPLTVSYAGDGTHIPSNANLTANVSKAGSSTAATAPKKVKYKKDFDVKATVTAPAGSNTGSVQVLEGTTVLGTGTLSNGVATIHITKNLKKGKHTLTVKYLGSANANGSQTTVEVKVKKKKKKN